MATTTALTVKDFLSLKLREDRKYELVAGEVVEVAYAKRRHELVKSNAMHLLCTYVASNPIGRVFAETMFELGETEARQPDVSLLLNEQIPAPLGDGLFDFAPALAVEVVSCGDLEQKVELFLEKGSRAVWVLYPEQRAIRICERSGVSRLLRGDQLVQTDFLPGFAVPAGRFFEGL